MSRVVSEAAQLLMSGGVTSPPVPVERLARDSGALVSYQPFETDDISGLLYRAEGAAPVIGVNSSNSKLRQRFTIAHELGHLLLHEGTGLIIERLVRVNFRNATSSTATDSEELEANRFAAELLMPEDLLQRILGSLLVGRPLSDIDLVKRLARRFEVSEQAMTFRLANLGILTVA
jgi:Zn-dependent peptidase ImmA (M78 family)